jgi:hypothetical protein
LPGEAEATRHHRIALEMTGEEPEVRLHVELGPDQALAVLSALLGDLGDAVEHQHGRQRQLRALAEQFATATGKQILKLVARAPAMHRCPCGFPVPDRVIP